MTNNSDALKAGLIRVLVVLGSLAGLAVVVWSTVVMLDLKHLNTSGFTLP
ncbi:hypothetical protein CPCC7001_455 [Cyanobium sp. PCC 7001]|nr:hypothetical protein [Cyanobium sp. PCC 7001]EDY37576.1 hypothetical protein CPCC7001_455 [Cyanobium sp. PCC 7001]